MNKKALLFSIFLAIIASMVIIAAIAIIASVAKDKTLYVGENEAKFFASMRAGEQHLAYLDASAQFAVRKTLIDFEKNGHYNENCGKHAEDFFIWKSKDNNCWPDVKSISNGFAKQFAGNINNYLSVYNGPLPTTSFFPKLSQADIVLNISEKKVYGKPFWSLPVVAAAGINYAIRPNFFASTDYDFNYDKIKEILEDVNEKCKNQQDLNVIDKMDLHGCVGYVLENINKDQTDYVFSLDCEKAKQDPYAELQRTCDDAKDEKCRCGKVGTDYLTKGPAPVGGKAAVLIRAALSDQEKGYPLCRIEDRLMKICIDHKKKVLVNGELKLLITKFAYYIDDEAAPPKIDFTVDRNTIKWSTPAADVKEYIVYFGQQGEKSATITRESNYAQTLAYELGSGTHLVSVVAVDYSGQQSDKIEQPVTIS